MADLSKRALELFARRVLDGKENGSEPGNLDLGLLRRFNVARCEQVFHKLNSWSLNDWATAAGGELGEAQNVSKKLRRLDDADSKQDSPEQRRKLTAMLAVELADALIYIDLLAARAGIDLAVAVSLKFNIVSLERGSSVLLNYETVARKIVEANMRDAGMRDPQNGISIELFNEKMAEYMAQNVPHRPEDDGSAARKIPPTLAPSIWTAGIDESKAGADETAVAIVDREVAADFYDQRGAKDREESRGDGTMDHFYKE